ncbi:MAG TPA: GGDEF domain-containing protein [Vicinamibacterales bacterium]|nr:GGDEF domain-containing protein [Vicinamibacterales bacterium]
MAPSADVITISPRLAASMGATVACGLLLLLWAYRRRVFILLWSAGWALAACVPFLQPAVGGGAAIASAAAFLAGIFRFSGPLAWRRDGTMLVGALAVVTVAAAVLPSQVWLALLALVIGALNAATAWHAGRIGQRHRLAGGYTLSAALAVAAASSLVTASVDVDASRAGAEWLSRAMLLVNGLAYVIVALGQHLFVFEDMLLELRDSNHELMAARAELHHAAITDPLTGLYNRRLFGEVSVHHLEHHRRFGLPLSLIYIDVDRFKYVNDTLGHDVGDRALAHVGHFIRRQVREADYVFRLGGDEFVVLISCNGVEATRRARKLQAALPPTLLDAGLPDALSLSVGVAEVHMDARDLDAAIQEADTRMYEDKRHRSQVPVQV